MQTWKTIQGYEDYMISNFGDVKSLKSGKEHIIRQHKDSKGRYVFVCLCKNGIRKQFLVHRLVANAFIDNKEGKSQVNHKNCDTNDNRAENLEWVTPKENVDYCRSLGRNSKPPSFKGNFGKHHNKSIGYILLCPDGIKRKFYSGLEFKRKTGLDNTSLSYAARKKEIPHNFNHGKMKGYVLLETFKSYVGKL